ncbi:MAG: DUF2652 domain-containing protein [Actinomycetota bacterium]
MGVQRGCLVLADIGGYSAYLAGVELEHSQDILADLLATVINELRTALELAKLEGDAVFAYDIDPPNGQDPRDLPGLVQECYFAFQRRLRNIAHLTTCDCNACSRIPRLDLKFLVHHGQFILHDIVGQRELLGPDIVLVHRLLKNSVVKSTGLHGYALFTRACLERFGLDPVALGMTPHHESYEDAGDVDCFLLDLEARWRDEQGRPVLYLAAGQAPFEVDAELPGDVERAWEYVTSPAKRPLWQPEVIRIETEGSGPIGVGTTNHCVHGGYAVREEILDWKPAQYVSMRWTTPFGQTSGTIELAPLGKGGARVSLRMQPDSDEARAVFADVVEPMRQSYEQGLAKLAEILVAEPAVPS